MQRNAPNQFTGILLAAGKGLRFDPAGRLNKLMQPFGNGDTVAGASAGSLLATLPLVLAVVRPGARDVAAQLHAVGCVVTECPDADQGMAASLVHSLTQTQESAGWIIALADMPYVQAATISALVGALRSGAGIAAPTFEGRRGNPVAFSRLHLSELMRLGGDQGARSLLARYPVTDIAVDDAGTCRDIDTASDLEAR
jgi:molybdenum cofactor cytidylyltransferase